MTRLGIAALLTATIATPAIAQVAPTEREVPVTLRPALDRPGTVFEGWGTALAWFAHVTGGWPQAERARLADLFYGPGGLGWTIARYNIGGGARPDAKPLSQPGANVPGFWRMPAGARGGWNPEDAAAWDWSSDANQRWWLDAIAARVKSPVLEAFSNSPPWFMTVSGEVSGAVDRNADNLRPGQEQAFARYLARVTDELQRRHRITFRTLSPVNEPGTDYWYAGNRQEGSHWSPARQAAMIDATDAALKERGLRTVVSAPDETNSHLFLRDWAAYPPATRARIGQVNVHSYGTVHQTGVRDAARAANIRLWMSEDDNPLDGDPESFVGMNSALAFAEHVVADLKRLEPAAWVLWQAVESFSGSGGQRGGGQGGSNWGLVKADLRAPAAGPHDIRLTRKYWAIAQFSRFIRPGYRLVPVDDMDTAGALSPDGNTLVLVHVNGGLNPRRLGLPTGWRVATIVTDAAREAACAAAGVAPPRAVATVILTRKGVPSPC